jgi:hypothetical protein
MEKGKPESIGIVPMVIYYKRHFPIAFLVAPFIPEYLRFGSTTNKAPASRKASLTADRKAQLV